MIILGIESSCDETAAAVVTDNREILSNEVLSQIDEHAPYGGVVPEIAARAHLDAIDTIVERAMKNAGVKFSELDAIAATGGPGLIGGVLVGVGVNVGTGVEVGTIGVDVGRVPFGPCSNTCKKPSPAR